LCSAETVAMLKEAMLAVVEDKHGTGHKVLYDSAYKISGKTGTAVSAMDNRGYSKYNKVYQASFIGYFPSQAPKYTMAVVIQNTRESKLVYGAEVSGAVFKEISDKLCARFLTSNTYPLYYKKDTLVQTAKGYKNDMRSITTFFNMPHVASDSESGSWRNIFISNNNIVLNKNEESTKNTVPNVKGMGLKDALYLLENRGLKVTVYGKGKVSEQSIIAGTKFNKGQGINITLN
jgi:cell division protein FtsI (penicillin-binding protein 3)